MTESLRDLVLETATLTAQAHAQAQAHDPTKSIVEYTQHGQNLRLQKHGWRWHLELDGQTLFTFPGRDIDYDKAVRHAAATLAGWLAGQR